MKYSFLIFVVAVSTLTGCASQPKAAATADTTSVEPWLCQGVDGTWQCQRGGTLEPVKGEQADVAAIEETQTAIRQSAVEVVTPSPATPTAVDLASSPVTRPQPQPQPQPQNNDGGLWTIQWVALGSEAAAKAFAATHFADTTVDYDIKQTQVGPRRFYILFSGRYATRALAAQAAAQTPLRSGEAPYLRTLASIAAASVD